MKYTSATLRRRSDKTGSPWQGILKYKDENEVWRQASRYFTEAKTKGAAQKALAAWRLEMEQQAARQTRPAQCSRPLAPYCAEYVDALESTGAVEPSTVADYRKCLRNLGEMGNTPLDALTATQIQAWEVSLLERLSPVTVGKAHRVLRQCMRHAVEVGDLDHDPTLGVKPPKRPTKQPNALDASGRARLVSILAEMEPTPLKVGACLALYAGMRQGEACGLRWKNVDLESGVIWVREAIGRGQGGTYAKEPKTGGSRRDIPIAEPLADVLRARRLATMEECAAAGVPFSAELYVLGTIDGAWFGPSALGKLWTSLARSYGLRGVTGQTVTFHDLRHTFATTAIAEGVDVKTVASMMGHANAAMTLNTYASADPDAKRRAAGAIGQAMARPAPMAEVIESGKGAAGAM